jgi:hypothetical protein
VSLAEMTRSYSVSDDWSEIVLSVLLAAFNCVTRLANCADQTDQGGSGPLRASTHSVSCGECSLRFTELFAALFGFLRGVARETATCIVAMRINAQWNTSSYST